MPIGSLQNQSSSFEDRRYFPRWEVNNRIVYQLEKSLATFEGFTKDLSCAGTCVSTLERLKINQRLRLTIYLSKDKKVTVQGNVVWVKPTHECQWAGIDFYNTTYQDQDLILECAFELNKKDLVRYWFKGWA